jgi:predicted transcriptional regulator
MTQQQLASAAEMPQASIARIEAGSVTPRTATLIALLKATGHELVAEPIGQSVPTEAIRKRLA